MQNPEDPHTAFGPRLAALRKHRGLTQVELAEKIGVSQRVITYYENESPRPPTQLLPQLADALEVSIGELFDDDGSRTPATVPDSAMLRRLEKLQRLPESERSAILEMIDRLSGDDSA